MFFFFFFSFFFFFFFFFIVRVRWDELLAITFRGFRFLVLLISVFVGQVQIITSLEVTVRQVEIRVILSQTLW
jgi:hypothetical protein